MSPRPTADEVALLEVFSAFTGTAVGLGASIPLRTLVRCRYWYGRTVEPALERYPGIWKDGPRNYVLDQVQRIGGHAATDAILAKGVISTEILDAAVLRIIYEQKPVCDRLAKRKKLKLLGAFCAGFD